MNNQTNQAAELPERLFFVDHGRDCGNAIRFELHDKNGNLIASLEGDDEKQAARDGKEIERRYNSQPELVAALRKLFAMVETGVLVRDCSKDADPQWYLQVMKLTVALKSAQDAIANATR